MDIFKDTVSIHGVSMHYLLRGTVERGAELWNPNNEEYAMLKGAVIGGPSLVFTRYHIMGITRIRSDQIANPKPCHKIHGYDINTLYLSTMRRDMPCGKGEVVRFDDPSGAAADFGFGFTKVDIKIFRALWPKFEEMCLFFINKQVLEEAVPEHMLDYLQNTRRTHGNGRKLCGVLSTEKMLIYTPLLHW